MLITLPVAHPVGEPWPWSSGSFGQQVRGFAMLATPPVLLLIPVAVLLGQDTAWHRLAALCLLGVVVCWAPVGHQLWGGRHRGRLLLVTEDDALWVRAPQTRLLAPLVCTAALGVVIAGHAVAEGEALMTPFHDVVIGVGSVLLWGWVLRSLLGPRPRGGVRLGRDGVHYRSAWGSATLAWDEVEAGCGPGGLLCLDAAPDQGLYRRWTVPGSDPWLVAALVGFYRAHPERRVELGTEVAVARVERGNFLADA